MAILFCIGTIFSATATGGMVQANGITRNLVETFGGICGDQRPISASLNIAGRDFAVAKIVIGFVMSVLLFIIIVGGIKSIGNVAEKPVPSMALLYVVMNLVVSP